MSLYSLDETFRSQITETLDDKGRSTSTASRQFAAFVSATTDGDFAVRYGTGSSDGNTTPRVRDAHPDYYILRAESVSIVKVAPLKFDVTVNYKSPAYRDGADVPWNQPTEIEYFGNSVDAEVDEDVNGNPIVTAAGEKIEGITRTFTDMGIRLAKNFISFEPAAFYLYSDKVNSDTFAGFPPGTLKVQNIGAKEQWFEGQTPYVAVTCEIMARQPYRTTNAKAWWSRVRHEGYYCWNSGGTTVGKAIDNQTKSPSDRPVLLDVNGKQIDMDLYTPPTAPPAVWLEWELYETISFSSMGF